MTSSVFCFNPRFDRHKVAQHSVRPIPDKVRRGHTGTARFARQIECRCGGGSLRVFRQYTWLEVGSVKMALSRPGRTPGWYPIPPTSAHRPCQGADAIPRRLPRSGVRSITHTVSPLTDHLANRVWQNYTTSLSTSLQILL